MHPFTLLQTEFDSSPNQTHLNQLIQIFNRSVNKPCLVPLGFCVFVCCFSYSLPSPVSSLVSRLFCDLCFSPVCPISSGYCVDQWYSQLVFSSAQIYCICTQVLGEWRVFSHWSRVNILTVIRKTVRRLFATIVTFIYLRSNYRENVQF